MQISGIKTVFWPLIYKIWQTQSYSESSHSSPATVFWGSVPAPSFLASFSGGLVFKFYTMTLQNNSSLLNFKASATILSVAYNIIFQLSQTSLKLTLIYIPVKRSLLALLPWLPAIKQLSFRNFGDSIILFFYLIMSFNLS